MFTLPVVKKGRIVRDCSGRWFVLVHLLTIAEMVRMIAGAGVGYGMASVSWCCCCPSVAVDKAVVS